MLHVLLTILKIIGILLLVILGIILVLILLVLFVPIRYRVHVRKVQELLQADGGVTWLLRLFRIDAAYEDMKADVVISIAGKKIKTLHWPHSDDEDQAASLQLQENASAQECTSVQEETQSPSAGEQNEHDSGRAQIESDSSEAQQDHGSAEMKAESESSRSGSKSPSSDTISDGSDSDASADQGAEAKQDDIDALASELKEKVQESKAGKAISQIISAVLRLIEKLLDLVLRLLELPYDVYDKMDTVESRIAAKFSAIRKKVSPFLSIEGEHVIGRLWRGVKHLGRCYGPRKIAGYLNFGTSYPDLTGKITGLIYVLLPQAGNEYSVEPDFYDAVLETDTVITGHIRLNHVVWIAIRLLFDKEFWILLRKIRGKEKVKGHKGPKGGRSDASDVMNGAEDDVRGTQAAENGAEGSGDRGSDDDRVDHNKPKRKTGKKKSRKKKTGNRRISKKR